MKLYNLLFAVLLIVAFVSCNNEKVDKRFLIDTSDIEIDFKLKRFEMELLNMSKETVLKDEDYQILDSAQKDYFYRYYGQEMGDSAIILFLKLQKALNMSEVERLDEEYNKYFDFFNEINLHNSPDDKDYNKRLGEYFANLKLSFNIYNYFDDLDIEEIELKNAFTRLNYYFPDLIIPDVYTHIGLNDQFQREDCKVPVIDESGNLGYNMWHNDVRQYFKKENYNQKLFVDDENIIVNLDSYLGEDHPAYGLMVLLANDSEFARGYYSDRSINEERVFNLHPYMVSKFKREYMVYDVMFKWLDFNFPINDAKITLLDQMIHHGKILYLLDALYPCADDYLKMRYKPNQIVWCEDNEYTLWQHLVSNEKLYLKDEQEIRDFIEVRKSSKKGFGTEDAPERVVLWLGWQIVRSYMKTNEDSIEELMNNNDYQFILNNSEYSPEENTQ
jgi:hypothetical protein